MAIVPSGSVTDAMKAASMPSSSAALDTCSEGEKTYPVSSTLLHCKRARNQTHLGDRLLALEQVLVELSEEAAQLLMQMSQYFIAGTIRGQAPD